MYYEIKYAYPSSEMAKQLNKNVTGCFYVLLHNVLVDDSFNSLEAAREFAQSTGYQASFHSMDIYTPKKELVSTRDELVYLLNEAKKVMEKYSPVLSKLADSDDLDFYREWDNFGDTLDNISYDLGVDL